MDDSNPNLKMVLYGNEYFAINQEEYLALPAQPLPQRLPIPKRVKSPAKTLPAKRALPFDKPVKRSSKRTDRKEDSSEATTSEDAEREEDGNNTTPTTAIKRRQATTTPAGHVSIEMFNLVVERLEILQASYQSLQEQRQDSLQRMCDTITRMDSQFCMHSTTLTRMENQILDTDTRVDVVEANVKCLQHAAASTASQRSTMDANVRKMADQITRLEGGASNNIQREGNNNSSSFFIGGMYALSRINSMLYFFINSMLYFISITLI